MESTLKKLALRGKLKYWTGGDQFKNIEGFIFCLQAFEFEFLIHLTSYGPLPFKRPISFWDAHAPQRSTKHLW